MKRIILSLCLFIFIRTEAQQINPVPDYVFSNKMSVGRNAVTDTAAYFSIGPRYGAVRGFMPPMVTDTATITTGKRNGLTIFSIQKNKYMYWDSVRVQWSDFAGSSGAYIFATDTASMLSPYLRAAGYALSKSGQTISADTSLLATRAWRKKGDDSLGAVIATKVNISDTSSMLGNYIRHAGNGLSKTGQALSVDTAAIATRARVQKAVDSINTNVALKVNISDTASMLTPYTRGSGTTNYLPKFTGSRTFGNSIAYDNGSELLVNTTSDAGDFKLQVIGNQYISGTQSIGTTTAPIGSKRTRYAYEGGIEFERSDGGQTGLITTFNSYDLLINNNNASITMERVSGKIFFNPSNTNEVYVNTSTDAGAYALQVAGAIYNTTTITTGAPTSGSAKPWRLGEAATVSPTSPNRTIRVEIDGTVYYIHAKTTND